MVDNPIGFRDAVIATTSEEASTDDAAMYLEPLYLPGPMYGLLPLYLETGMSLRCGQIVEMKVKGTDDWVPAVVQLDHGDGTFDLSDANGVLLAEKRRARDLRPIVTTSAAGSDRRCQC